MIENQLTVLSGIAGSGKSTLASFICRELSESYNIIQLAPTGKAAAVIRRKNEELKFDQPNVGTIHSFLCNGDVFSRFTKGDKPILFHIDESSMLDLLICVRLFIAMLKFNCKILVTGDHKQLAPVDFGFPYQIILQHVNKKYILKLDRNERIESAFGKLIIKRFKNGRSGNIGEYVAASKKKFKKKLNVDVYGKIDDHVISYTDKTFYSKIQKLLCEGYQFTTYNNDMCKSVNETCKQIVSMRDAKIDKMDLYNIRQSFADGDQVMILKNGYDNESVIKYYNGQEGIISDMVVKRCSIIQFKLQSFDVVNGAITPRGEPVQIKFTGEHLSKYRTASLLAHSWCKTIHKTQGDGFEKICLILDGKTMTKTALNTALTRVRKNLSGFIQRNMEI